jgi:ATP-binding cassette, subfamily B, bacterial RamB/AmfA
MSRERRPTRLRQVLLSSLRGRGSDLRWLAFWSALEAIPAFLSGRLVAQAIDDGFLADRPGTGFMWLGVLAASVLVGAWGTRQTYLRLADLVEPFRDELVARTVTGALHRSTTTGAPAETAGVARLTQQVEIVREAYASVLMVVQGFLVTTVSALVGLLTLVPAVLVLVLPPLLLGLALFFGALAGMASRQRTSIMADERIAEAIGTLTAGLRDVIACGAEEKARAAVGRHIDAQARATRELARFTAMRTVAIAIGGLLPLVLILVGGSWLIRQGASTGAILGALTYVSQGVQPALQALVRGVGNTGLWLVVALRRIVDATDDGERAATARAVDAAAPNEPRRHDLRLSDVTFSYGAGAEPVIRQLDLVVPEGGHLAVAGPSGVGKSTLAGLVSGLLEPDAGEIRIGGTPLDQLDGPTLARHRALIPQEAYVFAGTVLENITYLREGASMAEINHAVHQLGLRSLVARLGGYAATFDPHSLSAGELQLVTLLRAYLSPAPLVVLDEATCHLDPATEAHVEHAFARRPGTLIVIAHRISSALRARRILVLDGTEPCLGTHDDLLVRSALYRDLVGHWDCGLGPPVPAPAYEQRPLLRKPAAS